MKIVIDNMMKYFNVDEDSLEKEKVHNIKIILE